MALGVLVVGFGVATVRMFVVPPLDAPGRADAIVVLGGVAGGVNRGLELSRAGVAPTLVVSSASGKCPRVQAAVGARSRVVCFRPEPFTTQGEAREIRVLAGQERWQSVIVIARSTQASRARLRVERCFDGDVRMVAPPMAGWDVPYNVAYEWGALVKALVLQRDC